MDAGFAVDVVAVEGLTHENNTVHPDRTRFAGIRTARHRGSPGQTLEDQRRNFTVAVAKTMPAESYNFRPNPEEMNFGQVMAHIALANLAAC